MRLHDYEPKMFVNRIMILAAALMTGGVAGMWIFRDRFQTDIPRMIMLTGLDIMMILLAIREYRTSRENFIASEELKKQRDEMKNEDFSDNSIFFDDDNK